MANWMTDEDRKFSDEWEKAKKHKPGKGMLILLIWCLLYGIGIIMLTKGDKPAGEKNLAIWLIVLGISLVSLISWTIVMISRYRIYKQMKDLPEVKDYETRRKKAEEEERKRIEAEKAAAEAEERRRQKEMSEARIRRHAKNELIVCASARVNGHYDDNGTRQVYVDGRPFAEARPWAVIGLQPGYHSVYVVYTESVGGSIYRGQTDTVTICADEESAVLFATRNSLRIAPVQTFGISSIDEVIRLAKQEGAPSPTF